MISAARVRAVAPALVCLVLAGCVPSHSMTPELAPDRTCPRRGEQDWFHPTESGDNRRLEAWCLTVGPPVVRERPAGSFGGLTPGAILRVLSWNVDVGGGDLPGLLQSETGLGCAGEDSALRAGAGHFVLLVQEAFRRSPALPPVHDERVIPRAVTEEPRPGGRPDVVEVADRCGLSLAYVAASRNGPGVEGEVPEDKGVALLSTLPLDDVHFAELPHEAARRVAVGAVIADTAGRRLRLLNVHFISAAPPARVLLTGNGSRLRQGLATLDVLHLLDEAEGDGSATSTLLAGDFNTWSSDESALRQLREEFRDSPPALAEPTRGAFPTDHMLFREGSGAAPRLADSTYVRLEDRYHSDHHPIIADVRFPD